MKKMIFNIMNTMFLMVVLIISFVSVVIIFKFLPIPKNIKEVLTAIATIILTGVFLFIIDKITFNIFKKDTASTNRERIENYYAKTAVGKNRYNTRIEAGIKLIGTDGDLFNQAFLIKDTVIIGKDRENTDACFYKEEIFVDNVHCKVVNNNGKIELIDLGSKSGTFLKNGTRLEVNVPYELYNKAEFYLGDRENSFTIEY